MAIDLKKLVPKPSPKGKGKDKDKDKDKDKGKSKDKAQVKPAATAAEPKPPREPDPRVKEIFLNGLIFQNPILVLFLGMCSTLAVSTSLINALGMGLSTTAVLICSNVVISLLRKYIPKEVRIACYVVTIAGFVTIVDLCLKAFLPALSESLGIFIPLIVVNCILLGRAEAFASKEPPKYAALDGLAMGLGFTAALCAMGFIRELLGSGAILGHEILPFKILLIAAPCGGFLVLGFLVALVQHLRAHPPQMPKRKEQVSAPAAAVEKGGDAQ